MVGQLASSPARQLGVEQATEGVLGDVGDAGVPGDHGRDDGAVHQQCDFVGQLVGVVHARLDAQAADERQHLPLVAECQLAQPVGGLVVLGDGVDKRAAVEPLLPEPLAEEGEDRQQACARVRPGLCRRGDEPVAPDLTLGAENRLDEMLLRAEQLVERGLGGAGFLDDGVDADCVDAALAEQVGRRGDQPAARRRVDLLAGTAWRHDFGILSGSRDVQTGQ